MSRCEPGADSTTGFVDAPETAAGKLVEVDTAVVDEADGVTTDGSEMDEVMIGVEELKEVKQAMTARRLKRRSL